MLKRNDLFKNMHSCITGSIEKIFEKSLIEKEQLFLGDAVNWKTITIFFCLIRTKGHYIDRHMATSFFYYTKRFFNKYTHALQYYSDRFSGRPSMKCL